MSHNESFLIMDDSTILHNIRAEKLYSLFQEVRDDLIELKNKFEPKIPDELMSPKEVAHMLKCDLSTIYNWAKKGRLIRHGIGNRTYYKRHEVESAIIQY
jgi:excisionase family DNA binding protein